jgi:hypothetical protein
MGGPRGRSGWVCKISPPTGFRNSDRPTYRELLHALHYPSPILLYPLQQVTCPQDVWKVCIHFSCKLQLKEHGNELHLMSEECICTYSMRADENTWVSVKGICDMETLHDDVQC